MSLLTHMAASLAALPLTPRTPVLSPLSFHDLPHIQRGFGGKNNRVYTLNWFMIKFIGQVMLNKMLPGVVPPAALMALNSELTRCDGQCVLLGVCVQSAFCWQRTCSWEELYAEVSHLV